MTAPSIRIGGRLLDLSTPRVMGIVNATPDSFYGGSRQQTVDAALRTVEHMVADGADMVDIGGQSTRPGAVRISADEEIQRVVPLIAAIHARFPELVVSIDTFYGAVAREAVAAGAAIVNDISAWSIDPEIFTAVAEMRVPYILMHMQGTPETMQLNPTYTDVVNEVYAFFSHKLAQLRLAGVADVILDPGFGFGKTLTHNYELLARLAEFEPLGCTVLAGVSRKGMIYKLLETTSEAALNGTTVANTIALMNGARILRVHDVRAAAEAVKLFSFTRENAR